ITVEEPEGLFVRGSVMRGIVSDRRSPIMYGHDGAQLPGYFNTAPVLSAGGAGGGGGFGGGGGANPGQNITPMATRLRLSPWDSTMQGGQQGQGGAAAAGPGGPGGFGGGAAAGERPRVIMSFPQNPNDMLLSGTLAGGQALAGRAQVIDAPMGQGHVVMFGIRPFWRWQTHGTYFMGFNAILNWNDLSAGREPANGRPASQ
ncbi:MAG: hypothetical protein JNJ98_10545, partial [Gemmatimonadetes bacterium]|nr:hypothetical protein [Gemmatimonadota bacterium]